MGIRSHVVFAAKHKVIDQLSPESLTFLEETFGEPADTCSEGVLYEHDYIKWYVHDYKDLAQFYQELDHAEDEEKFDGDDYLLIECCYDYPNIEGSEDNRGWWHGNPWDARPVVSTYVAWEATEE